MHVDADVNHARRVGATWQELGAAAGTTKQAAHEPWATTIDTRSDPALDELLGPVPGLDGD